MFSVFKRCRSQSRLVLKPTKIIWIWSKPYFRQQRGRLGTLVSQPWLYSLWRKAGCYFLRYQIPVALKSHSVSSQFSRKCLGQVQRHTCVIDSLLRSFSEFQDIPQVFLCDLFPNYAQQNKSNHFQIKRSIPKLSNTQGISVILSALQDPCGVPTVVPYPRGTQTSWAIQMLLTLRQTTILEDRGSLLSTINMLSSPILKVSAVLSMTKTSVSNSILRSRLDIKRKMRWSGIINLLGISTSGTCRQVYSSSYIRSFCPDLADHNDSVQCFFPPSWAPRT
jgi:hypothetical protein